MAPADAPTTTDDLRSVDVVVIGAGQAGLSAAAHLRRSGFVPVDAAESVAPTFVVLDAADGPGGAWRERWPTLTMRTVHSVYELPNRPLPQFDPELPAAQALPAYFGEFEAVEGLRVRRPVQVRAVREAEDGLLAVETVDRSGRPVGPVSSPVAAAPVVEDVLGCGAGTTRTPPPPMVRAAQAPRRVRRTWLARALINATGTWTRPFWPVYPGQREFAGVQLHTHDYRGPEGFADRDVLVVGGGTSAVQHLLAIHPVARSTTWVTRRPPEWVDAAFSPELGREAVARVEERTRAGLPPASIVSATGLSLTPEYRAGIDSGVLRARPMFDRLVPEGAQWTPGPVPEGWVDGPEQVPAQVVLWATGFRPAVDHLAPLRLRHANGGIELAGTRAVADSRIQLVGYGPSASTVGANRAGRAAAREVRRLLDV
ncbi:NAD(P)-binding domain-containing protein [Cellulomonas sp. NPDC089187]|uniref:NAD(P)-binding domain-containing protein n=1 Tax=Cellulomonas sp. NPDC089187 TaxID=3154970 RepID=UPI003445D0A6